MGKCEHNSDDVGRSVEEEKEPHEDASLQQVQEVSSQQVSG